MSRFRCAHSECSIVAASTDPESPRCQKRQETRRLSRRTHVSKDSHSTHINKKTSSATTSRNESDQTTLCAEQTINQTNCLLSEPEPNRHVFVEKFEHPLSFHVRACTAKRCSLCHKLRSPQGSGRVRTCTYFGLVWCSTGRIVKGWNCQNLAGPYLHVCLHL